MEVREATGGAMKKAPRRSEGLIFWCVSEREERVRSGLIRRSELEAHLHNTTEGVEGLACWR